MSFTVNCSRGDASIRRSMSSSSLLSSKSMNGSEESKIAMADMFNQHTPADTTCSSSRWRRAVEHTARASTDGPAREPERKHKFQRLKNSK